MRNVNARYRVERRTLRRLRRSPPVPKGVRPRILRGLGPTRVLPVPGPSGPVDGTRGRKILSRAGLGGKCRVGDSACPYPTRGDAQGVVRSSRAVVTGRAAPWFHPVTK